MKAPGLIPIMPDGAMYMMVKLFLCLYKLDEWEFFFVKNRHFLKIFEF